MDADGESKILLVLQALAHEAVNACKDEDLLDLVYKLLITA